MTPYSLTPWQLFLLGLVTGHRSIARAGMQAMAREAV